MSTYSQPPHSISHSDYSLANNEIYRPKYLNQSDDDKLNSTTDHQSNKLPLNLFHSAAEYNKMLITYGKNRTKNISQITDGIITSLEYVNDRIFEKQNQKRSRARNSIIFTIKNPKKSIENCTCCCCQEYCTQCANKRSKCHKLSHSNIAKAKQTIDHEIMMAKQRRTTTNLPKNKNIKQGYHKNYKKNKKSSYSRRSYSSMDGKRPKNIIENSSLNFSQKSRDVDISHLIIKSLIQFNQQRRVEEMIKMSNLNNKKAKEEYLQQLNNRIRMTNLSLSRRSKSKKSEKSLTKHDLGLKYWEQIRNQVLQSLKYDNYSKPLKKQLTNYKLNVYDHKQLPERKLKMSKQEIQVLRKIREEQAKRQINKKNQQKIEKTKIIRKNLQSLQQNRIHHIVSCQKKPFQPTADMIHNAFKNIVQPDLKSLVAEKQSSLFKNQRIKKTKNRK